MKWFRLAADQGNAYAQNNLGVIYGQGKGASQNYVLAYMWLTLAARNGSENAVRTLEVYEKQMTPAQLAEAHRLAREWKPKGE